MWSIKNHHITHKINLDIYPTVKYISQTSRINASTLINHLPDFEYCAYITNVLNGKWIQRNVNVSQ